MNGRKASDCPVCRHGEEKHTVGMAYGNPVWRCSDCPGGTCGEQ